MLLYPPLGQIGPWAISLWGIRTQTARIDVEGLDNVPATGPVLLLARHFHHLLDGAVIVMRLRRPVHIVVGLDWAATPFVRRWMERVCRAADYPIVLRPPTLDGSATYRREELVRYTRAALRDTTRLLRTGRVVLVFPEGYPTIDPSGARKFGADEWLPFAPGYLKMITEAERDGATRVAVVPVGFHYQRAGERWAIRVRFGPVLQSGEHDVATVQQRVRALSQMGGAAG